MVQLRYITPTFAVAGALQPEDFAELARLGFKGVISNRPDGEEWGQLTAANSAELAETAGLAFRHVPAAKHDIFSPAVGSAMQAAMTAVGEPAVAHCKSGLRSALLWALVKAGDTPVDQIIAAVREAGYDLSGLAEEIAAAGERRG